MIFEMTILMIELVVVVLLVIYILITGIPPMPTSPKVRKTMIEAIPPDIQGKIFELGSGWGSLAFPLAKQFPDCTILAFEISPVPWLFTKLRYFFCPLPNLIIHRANFHKISLEEAALAVCFLMPRGMKKLESKFEAELPSNSLIISNFFAVPGWNPHSIRQANDLYSTKIYIYKMPSLPDA